MVDKKKNKKIKINEIKNVKGAINSLLKKTWLFALIGGIIALVGIFTPAATIIYLETEVDAHIWLGGIMYFTGEYKIEGPGQITMPGGFSTVGSDAIGIYALVLITVSAVFLIFYSFLTGRGKNFKVIRDVYLSTGIVMIVAFTFWLIAISDVISLLKAISFGFFSPFIAGAIAIVVGIYDRKRVV